jgi:type I restriction enzyme S subunit
MDQIPESEIKKHLLPLAHKYLDLNKYRLVVFGSRAAGTAQPTSDLDIGIEGPTPVPRHLLAHLREEIKETPLLYKVDIIDLTTASDAFKRLARKDAKPITP